MTVRQFALALAAGALLAGGFPAAAGTLQVSPITVEVTAPNSGTTMTLENLGAREIRAQIRVFRWTKSAAGEDLLEPTTDVIASPPGATLQPKTKYTVRLVRTAKRPVAGEESYRIFVDELPDPALLRNGAVGMVLRQSIPVFFGAPDRTRAQVEWSLVQSGGKLTVTATNAGQRRVQLSEVVLQDQNGRNIVIGSGLVGYALGETTSRWTRTVPSSLRGPVTLKAQTDLGPLDVKTTVKAQ